MHKGGRKQPFFPGADEEKAARDRRRGPDPLRRRSHVEQGERVPWQ